MKTRRKATETEEMLRVDKSMAPRPEESPVSTPRTRSPAKGVRTGGVTCAGPDALSMLNMLAEVASVTLHTDPSVTDTNSIYKSKASSATSRKPSDYELLTLEHVAGMTDNLLVKLFAEFESNEMWKRFTYTCGMLPAACSKYFQSFGSEHKARAGMKSHLQVHLKSLMDVHKSTQSRQSYVLESIPARNRRLAQQEGSGSRKRNLSTNGRGCKSGGSPRTLTRIADNASRPKKVSTVTPEKENEFCKKRDGIGISKDKKIGQPSVRTDEMQVDAKTTQEIVVMDLKQPKRKVEITGKVRAKKVKCVASEMQATNSNINDNNNNNNSDMKVDIKQERKEDKSPPIQQVVSHDHVYLKAAPSINYENKEQVDVGAGAVFTTDGPQRFTGQEPCQISWSSGGCINGSVGNVYIKECPSEDRSTLLHQHMNQELCGGIMAQDSGSSGTPLPVVGCEVEFTPDQQYKIMRSDLPVVYDHNNPSDSVETVSKVIERDEYKVRKKPKGRAKFIGQSKAEKEMALKLITEIRSQSVMALDTLECKICHPPRLFTAPSTLLSHYRSHAGIRPYECRICEAVFTRQHSLNYHMLIHTNQTRFTCVDCGRKFRHPSHFKEHRRRHTGESPYECSDCLMRFKTRNTYKRHLRTRHGKLLTTQGAIIILSQEEADRMKKTQGRKPRRPRQPLKIISPETAAQMEEEQIWTDFEECDREEEDEDEDDDEEEEEEEEEGSHTDESLQSGDHTDVGGCQLLSSTLVKAVGVQQIANGKTGLHVRSNKLSTSKDNIRSSHVGGGNDWENPLALEKKAEDIFLEERVEEEVITEEVAMDDLRTYVFQPPPEHNSLPKVNIRSSWNTINIDLKSLEKATEPVVEGNSKRGDCMEDVKGDIIGQEAEVTAQMVDGSSEFVGDQISPEEVITICAGVESMNEEAIMSPVARHHSGSGKNDWFTVKKPQKCYGRPGYSMVESGASISSETMAITQGAHPDTNINSNDGHGVYVVEYIQGRDGRLAKVYHANASLVNRNNQQISTQTGTITNANTLAGSSVNKNMTMPVTTVPSTAACNSFTSSVNSSKLVVRAAARDCMKLQTVGNMYNTGASTIAPSRTMSIINGPYSNHDKALINKQVVNNVVLNNHIVKNGSLVSISSGDLQRTSLAMTPSPPVVVTSVPCITDSRSVSISQDNQPWSSQTINSSRRLSPISVTSSKKGLKKGTVTHIKNQVTYPAVKHEIEQSVTIKNNLLLKNVEIIDHLDVGNSVFSVAGIIEEGKNDRHGEQDVYINMPVEHPQKSLECLVPSNSKVKVEEVRPLEAISEYPDQLLHKHENQNDYTASDVLPPAVCSAATQALHLLPSKSLTQHASTNYNANTVQTITSSHLAPVLQI
nr:uncharacterized protein LOC123747389 isoform X2 [Procambarus clarkii]